MVPTIGRTFRRGPWSLMLGVGIGWLPALLGYEVVARVSGLNSLSAGPHPYFQLSHAWLLYVITPVVVISSFLLYLSPGGILILAFGKARSIAEWVVLAFGSSLMLNAILTTLAELIPGTLLTFPLLASLWATIVLVAWLILLFRLQKGTALPWPIAGPQDVRHILWMLSVIFVGVAGLVPKIFWENFNLDGIEAFEFGRSLTSHLLPYWEIQNGIFGFYHNFFLFAYPNHWFLRILGPLEASARLPFFLYLIVLFAALVLLIEWAGVRKLSWREELVLWLGLLLYTVVQTFNTNYEPFFADLAETAATDTLQMACFVSCCYTLWAGRTKWFWIFGLMTYCATPGGLLLLGALAVATFLIRSPDRKQHLQTLGKVLLLCVFIGLAYETLYSPRILGSVNNQFSAKNMLRRLYPPTVTEFVRVNAVLFPSGILPALSLLAAKRKDPAGWKVAVVTLLYFFILYSQAWTSLHQFTPVMVLPLVVFWRIYLNSSLQAQRWLLPAVAATTILSIFLSLPRHFQINRAIREFGLATEYRIGDYEKSYESAMRGGWSLFSLLPQDYRLKYPEQPWGADPPSWIYYATRPKPPGITINYVVQVASAPSPPGSTRVITRDGISVYVLNLQTWQRHRELKLPRVVQGRLYEPIYRRTFQFFRAYAERPRRKM